MTALSKFIPSESEGPPELKVLWVTNAWPDELRPHWGCFVRSQAQSLWRLGLDVDVLVVRGFLTKRAYFTMLPEVRRRIHDSRYRLVHAHFGHTATMAVVARPPVPLIISFCGEDLLGAPRANGRNTAKSTIESAVFRRLPRFAAATITKSRELETALPASARGRNTVLPNGVDMELFRRRPRREARAEVGWDPEAKIAMFLGDPADPRKRVELAREAVSLVAERMPGARLEVVFDKRPEEIPTYMSAADCLVFPSRSEGSPNAVKEAMAAELPIVATPVGDIPERFDGVAGCFVRPPEPRAFADALVEALEMGAAPQAREAIAPIGLERIGARLREIYERAVAAG